MDRPVPVSRPQETAGGGRGPVPHPSIEAFANDGEVSLSACFLPTDDRLELECERGPVRIRSLRLVELESIWKDARE